MWPALLKLIPLAMSAAGAGKKDEEKGGNIRVITVPEKDGPDEDPLRQKRNRRAQEYLKAHWRRSEDP